MLLSWSKLKGARKSSGLLIELSALSCIMHPSSPFTIHSPLWSTIIMICIFKIYAFKSWSIFQILFCFHSSFLTTFFVLLRMPADNRHHTDPSIVLHTWPDHTLKKDVVRSFKTTDCEYIPFIFLCFRSRWIRVGAHSKRTNEMLRMVFSNTHPSVTVVVS
jgi:hypothetical protein